MSTTLAGNGTAPTPSQSPPALVSILETFIPGLSLVSKFLLDYFKVDLSQYLWGILLVVALTSAVNYCSDKFWSVWNQYFVSTAQIHYNDEIYNYIMFWISKHKVSRNAMHFVVGVRTNSAYVYTEESDEEGPDEDYDEDVVTGQQPRNLDNMKMLRYTPSQGTHYLRFKGRWISFTRTQEKESGFYGSSMKESISLSCPGRNPQVLKDLIQEAQRAYMERDGNKTVIYRGSKQIGSSGEDMEWLRCVSRPPRPLHTVVLDDLQKKSILDDMREYLNPRTRRWYSNRGIPYRRGYLLEGPPGTGKTSLCFALAGVLQLRIYVVSLNSRSITEESLASLFRELPWRCIVLLEDIDSAGIGTKRAEDAPLAVEKKSDPEEGELVEGPNNGTPPPAPSVHDAVVNKALSLSSLLNVIDGVTSSEGRILVMSTNHIERLDAALLRPGRVDLIVRFGYADGGMIQDMFKAIYSIFESEMPGHQQAAAKSTKTDTATQAPRRTTQNGAAAPSKLRQLGHGKTSDEISVLAKTFAEHMPHGEFTPAEIQNFLLGHKAQPEKAIEAVEAWVEKMREEKKKNRGA